MAPDAQAYAPGAWSATVVTILAGNLLAWTAHLAIVTALGVHVYGLTGRELDLGLLGVAEFAPMLLLLLLSGSVADRRDRRWVASSGFLLQTAAAGLFVYVVHAGGSLAVLLGVTALLGAGRALAGPSIRALASDLVDQPALPWLLARMTATTQAAFIGGPILGGSLYAAGAVLPFCAGAALLACAAALVSRVRAPAAQVAGATDRPPDAGAPLDRLRQALAGWRFIMDNPVLLGAVTIDLLAVLAGGAVALLPAIADVRLGVGPIALGYLRAGIGVGALATILVMTRWPVRRRIGPCLIGAVGVFGAGTVVLGQTRTFLVALVAVVVLSAADALSMYIRSTLLPMVTPPPMRGRVLAVEMVFIGASNQLGELESGILGQLLGPGPAVAIGGVATLIVVALWAIRFPSLRRLDRFPSRAA